VYSRVVSKTEASDAGAETTILTYRVDQTIVMQEKVGSILLHGTQIADLLGISGATWRGWVSKKLAPQPDEAYGKRPVWRLHTIIEYVRNAPGGRLGYPVG
jgi:hypothetical protein